MTRGPDDAERANAERDRASTRLDREIERLRTNPREKIGSAGDAGSNQNIPSFNKLSGALLLFGCLE